MTVPRGTPAQPVQIRFNPDLEAAIVRGDKTQTRRQIGPANSHMARGLLFSQLDLASGRPGGYRPCDSLQCRQNCAGGARRSVTLTPRVIPGALLWPRVGQSGPAAKFENASTWLRVLRVYPQRLNDIDQAGALAEGILWYGRTLTGEISGAAYVNAYKRLLAGLGPRHRTRWVVSDLHVNAQQAGVTPRDCFALLWESLNGVGSWRRNPWVWVYEFQTLEPWHE